MAIKPWVKIGDPKVLGERFGKSLTLQTYHNPNTGKDLDYALIGQRNWSVVLAITESGEVLVVTQYKAGCNCVIDELPAGTANSENEAEEDVAARELEEETGYKAGRMIDLGSAWPMTANSHTKFHCFLATGCTKASEGRLDTNEQIETCLVPLSGWIGMVMNGEVDEPSAITATVRALRHLGLTIV